MTEAQFNEYCPTIGKSSIYIRTTLDITYTDGKNGSFAIQIPTSIWSRRALYFNAH